jgi:hypothetical protein
LTAFLHSRLEEEVWEQPPGYEAGGARVKCTLLEALSGIPQAPQAWSDRLHEELEKMGLTVARADGSLLIYEAADGTKVWVLFYVDVGLQVTRSMKTLKSVRKRMSEVFDIRGFVDVEVFLGRDIKRE